MIAMKVNKNDWVREEKIKAREETIIKIYSVLFDQQSLPLDKQYWTLCSKCINDGKIIENTEPYQVINSGLIRPHQFHGVEIEIEIHNINKTCSDLNFYHGDLLSVLRQEAHKPDFNPAIVNADFFGTPITEAKKFLDILYLLRNQRDIMVVGNFSLQAKHKKFVPDDIIIELNKHSLVKEISKVWKYSQCYEYISSAYKMGTIIFYKRK